MQSIVKEKGDILGQTEKYLSIMGPFYRKMSGIPLC